MSRPTRFQPAGEQPFLLNPGPVNVSQGVAQALLRGDLCHREPEYAQLQSEIRRLLLQAFAPSGQHAAVLMTGSGTAAVEAAVSSLVSPQGELLVLQNGVYGDRLEKIAQAHGIRTRILHTEWTLPQDPQALDAFLGENPGVEVVAGVHHETTTGLLNPVRELAEVCRRHGRVFLLDAISAIGGEELDLEGWGVDVCVGSANKCIRGIAGMSFVLASTEVLERVSAYPPRTLYLHLPTYYSREGGQGVPFTPAVQVAYAFHTALQELLAEGVQARVDELGRVAALLRQGFARLGLGLLLDPRYLSRTITTVRLPADWSYDDLHDALRAEGYVIYAGQGHLRDIAFRVSNMGVMEQDEYRAFLAALERVIAKEVVR